MSKLSRLSLFGFFLLFAGTVSFAQSLGLPTSNSAGTGTMVSRQPESRAWTDPALNHNKLLQQQTEGGHFKLIGPYKVKGTPFLFGEKHKGDVFSETEKAWNIFISYNTYNQELEFYSSANPDQALVKEPGTLDSFKIQADASRNIHTDLKFVYGPVIGTQDKFYYREVCTGNRFKLYKRYKSEVGYVSSNYMQSELRQFDLEFEYYYSDTEKKQLKKLKKNSSDIIKEFKNVTDLSAVINAETFPADPEGEMCKAFTQLNAVKKGF